MFLRLLFPCYFCFVFVCGTPCSNDELIKYITCTNWNETEFGGNPQDVDACFTKNNCSATPTVPPPPRPTFATSPMPSTVSAAPSASPSGTIPPTLTSRVPSSATPYAPTTTYPGGLTINDVVTERPTTQSNRGRGSHGRGSHGRGSHGDGEHGHHGDHGSRGHGKGDGNDQGQNNNNQGDNRSKDKEHGKRHKSDDRRRKRQSVPPLDLKKCVKEQRDKFLTNVETCVKAKMASFVFQKGRTPQSLLISEASCPAMTKVSDCIENLKTKNLEKAKPKLCDNEKRCKKNSTCSVEESQRVICTCAESEITKSKGQIKKDFIQCLGPQANNTRTENGIGRIVDDKNIREFLMSQNELLTRFCVTEKKINCV